MAEKEAAAFILLALALDDDEKRRRGPTRKWIQRSEEEGLYADLVQELMVEDTRTYREMMRMDYDCSKHILQLIEPYITPQNSGVSGKRVATVGERLVLTIRFLAMGETFSSLNLQFRISERAISYIVDSVSKAIVSYIGKEYIKLPSCSREWLQISKTFLSRWNFPNCLGAIDGKHIQIRPPSDTGAEYFNYKKTFSIILLAIAGPDYECIYADIGSNGRMNDSGVWNASDMRENIEDDDLGIAAPKPLLFGWIKIPYVFVGDDAFALKTYMMKPYPQKNLTEERRAYNYRHSGARMISENLFGILANKWRIFQQPLNLSPEKSSTITTCALVLHNFLRRNSRNTYTPPGLTDYIDENGKLVQGSWRSDQANPPGVFSTAIPAQMGRKAFRSAKAIRETFTEDFINEGYVEWQWEKA